VKKSKDLRRGQPSKPVGLSEQASAYWDQLVAELAESGIELTPAHRSWLQMAATIADDIRIADARVKKDGAYVQGKQGLVAHPAAKRLDALRRDQIKVLSMLGLRQAVAEQPADTGPTFDDELED
jgi:phage terminase small subunit